MAKPLTDATNREKEQSAMMAFGLVFEGMKPFDRDAVAYIDYQLWPNDRDPDDAVLLRERRRQILSHYITQVNPEEDA